MRNPLLIVIRPYGGAGLARRASGPPLRRRPWKTLRRKRLPWRSRPGRAAAGGSQPLTVTNCHVLTTASVSASGDDGAGNVAARSQDDDVNTRWSGPGVGAWLRMDLGSVQTVSGVAVAWYLGAVQLDNFTLSASEDGADLLPSVHGHQRAEDAAQTYTFTPRKRALRARDRQRQHGEYLGLHQRGARVRCAARRPRRTRARRCRGAVPAERGDRRARWWRSAPACPARPSCAMARARTCPGRRRPPRRAGGTR